jgi:hypothetical protein
MTTYIINKTVTICYEIHIEAATEDEAVTKVENNDYSNTDIYSDEQTGEPQIEFVSLYNN